MLNQVLRYIPVIAALPNSGTTLLEVGSGSQGIAPYLQNTWAITACDVAFDDYGASRPGTGEQVVRVRASVLDLPFADASFDVVVALDLLEHLRSEDRRLALRELRRVTASLLIVGCPCGAGAEAADRRLATYYDRLGRPRPGWLTEHLSYGLPTRDLLLEAARPTDRAEMISNCNLSSYERVMRWEARPGLWRAPTAIAWGARALIQRSPKWVRFVRWSLALLAGRDRRPAYRHVAFVAIAAKR